MEEEKVAVCSPEFMLCRHTFAHVTAGICVNVCICVQSNSLGCTAIIVCMYHFVAYSTAGDDKVLRVWAGVWRGQSLCHLLAHLLLGDAGPDGARTAFCHA